MEKKSKDDRKSIEPHEWFWSILGMVVFVVLGVYTLMSASASG